MGLVRVYIDYIYDYSLILNKISSGQWLSGLIGLYIIMLIVYYMKLDDNPNDLVHETKVKKEKNKTFWERLGRVSLFIWIGYLVYKLYNYIVYNYKNGKK